LTYWVSLPSDQAGKPAALGSETLGDLAGPPPPSAGKVASHVLPKLMRKLLTLAPEGLVLPFHLRSHPDTRTGKVVTPLLDRCPACPVLLLQAVREGLPLLPHGDDFTAQLGHRVA
jgi:hypothetical protein